MSDLISRKKLRSRIWELCLFEDKVAEAVTEEDELLSSIIDEIDNASTVDAVPVTELLKLRDWFYESDGISMGNLGKLNELIAKHSNGEIPRLENGYERYDRP